MSLSTPASASIESIQQRVAPLQQQLTTHPLYSSIQSLPELRTFMESHVFAVWDFMSLLKSLQRTLTSVEVPWTPTDHPVSRRFVNEIVLAEESDEYEGRPISHFEMYVEAMRRAGADTSAITAVVAAAKSSDGNAIARVHLALDGAPIPAQDFVKTTFHLIQERSLAAQASAFTFGREDAIPAMFRSLVKDLNRDMDGDLSSFVWYLQRHIEIDGDDHGPLSLRMVADLCGSDTKLWEEAGQAAEEAIRARLHLWDGILSQIRK